MIAPKSTAHRSEIRYIGTNVQEYMEWNGSVCNEQFVVDCAVLEYGTAARRVWSIVGAFLASLLGGHLGDLLLSGIIYFIYKHTANGKSNQTRKHFSSCTRKVHTESDSNINKFLIRIARAHRMYARTCRWQMDTKRIISTSNGDRRGSYFTKASPSLTRARGWQ